MPSYRKGTNNLDQVNEQRRLRRDLQRIGGAVTTAFYVSTYCNFAHVLKTGRPIDHECYVIPPAALQAERDGDMDKACEIMRTKMRRVFVRGRKLKKAT